MTGSTKNNFNITSQENTASCTAITDDTKCKTGYQMGKHKDTNGSSTTQLILSHLCLNVNVHELFWQSVQRLGYDLEGRVRTDSVTYPSHVQYYKRLFFGRGLERPRRYTEHSFLRSAEVTRTATPPLPLLLNGVVHN